MTTVQITLPDDLARDLAEAGLLESKVVESLLRDRLRNLRVVEFGRMRTALEADPIEPMTEDEINAEIEAYRAGQQLAPGA